MLSGWAALEPLKEFRAGFMSEDRLSDLPPRCGRSLKPLAQLAMVLLVDVKAYTSLGGMSCPLACQLCSCKTLSSDVQRLIKLSEPPAGTPKVSRPQS